MAVTTGMIYAQRVLSSWERKSYRYSPQELEELLLSEAKHRLGMTIAEQMFDKRRYVIQSTGVAESLGDDMVIYRLGVLVTLASWNDAEVGELAVVGPGEMHMWTRARESPYIFETPRDGSKRFIGRSVPDDIGKYFDRGIPVWERVS